MQLLNRIRWNYLAPLLSLIWIVSSCVPNEIPIEKGNRGELILQQIDLGTDYSHQVYFDLENNSIVSHNRKTDWHIAIQSFEGISRFSLNSALFSKVFKYENADFDTVSYQPDSLWRYDAISGNLDSTAFGELMPGNLFIIDLGIDETGQSLGFQKIQILENSIERIQFRTSTLNGEFDTIISHERLNESDFLPFSFDSYSFLNSIPSFNDYDLLFSQYTHLFHSPFLPYLVTGVLINPNKIQVARIDSTQSFEQIDFAFALDQEYSTNRNEIGYDWKEYNFDLASFIIDSKLSYIIRTSNNRYFKLRFIDFYNDIGQKGSPKFEFQEL